MFSYLIRRLLYAPFIILGVMVVTFFLFFVVQSPENMARTRLGKRATTANIYDYLHKRGYDKPLFFNYGQARLGPDGKAHPDGHPYASKGFFDTIFFNQMGRFMVFDLGVSDVNGVRLSEIFRGGAIPSLLLTLPAFLAGFVASLGVALFLVFVRHSRVDTAGAIICVGLMSIPPMVYIIFGQSLVALQLNYFPAHGFYLDGWGAGRFLFLPVALMVVMGLGSEVRLYRAIFLEEIAQDYVRTAQAKGVGNARLLGVHVLKNGMIALITLLVAHLPLLILGSMLVENFFGIPGLGSLLVNSVQTQDFAVVQGVTFLVSILYIIGLTATDVCYALADPRIRLS